ncbi:MAG: flagellar hook-basal body complex protein FliE [Sulfobacillus sp.]|nr:flagellar hook-basal body complex protein FliE [Sulfobacillus sp.]
MNPLALQYLTPVTLNGGSTAASTVPMNFGALLGHAVNSLSQSQTQANQAIQAAMTGQISVTQAMVAMVTAQSQLDVATAVQNQAITAYQNIMNMPLS